MKDIRRILRKLLSLALCFALVLSATISLGEDSGKAQAKTSLPYIEGLKTTNQTFNILEIVPAAGQGSIGYYIAGQEPCANWIYDIAAITGQTARKDYMNNGTTGILTKLTTSGILGSGDVAPLESKGAYNEVYPWQDHPAESYTKLTLNTAEQTTARGSFTPSAGGAYTQSKGFSPQNGGNYVQVIKYFAARTISNGEYYYLPVFAPVENAPLDNNANYAIYTNTATINNPTASPTDDGYVYYGTTGAGFEGMEIGTKYYYVTSYGAPSTTKPTDATAKKYYVGISDAYQAVASGSGYFAINPSSLIYTYVGSGGTYNFNYDAGSTTTNNIICNTVYYTGGYYNNNWFLKNVFDWDVGDAAAKIKFKVSSVVGNNVTVEQVNAANLIVMSNGFNPNGAITSYKSSNDISSSTGNNVSSAITNVINVTNPDSKKVPIIVDYRLYNIPNPPTNLRTLAKSLYDNNKTGTNTTFVKNNIFFFNVDGARSALATNGFRTPYTPASNYNVSTGPFYAAYEVAVYENFIRDEEGSTAGHLETEVNMARAIRYIINYKGQRVESGKSSIKVLEIEPNSTSRLTPSSYKTLTGYTGDVTITCMSTLEFVGKSDDLIESYDAIYIGDNGGNTLSNSKLDSGYLYENIGASVTTRTDAVGLTDSEYSSTTTFTGADGKTYYALKDPQTTRYSGNDLSTKKLDALNKYAVAGHPVIIADGLACNYSIVATVSGVQSTDGTSAILTASASITGTNPATAGPRYTWYRLNTDDTSTMIGSENVTSNTYTASSGEYYCRIRYTISSQYVYAYSNSVVVTASAAQIAITSGGNNTNGSATLNDYVFLYNTYQYEYSVNVTGNNGALSATAASTDQYTYGTPTCTYQWYKDDVAIGATGATYTPTASGTYYCQLSVSSVTRYSFPFYQTYTTTSSSFEISSVDPGKTKNAIVTYTPASAIITPGSRASRPITGPAVSGQSFYINVGTVDNCSNMYSFLNSNKSRGNVMRSGAVDKDTILRYTNTSKPTINLSSSPPVYVRGNTTTYIPANPDGDTDSANDTHTLKFDFTIDNPTDTTPLATEYYCNLYIDTDSDSRFIEQERIGNIEIREATAGVAGKLVDSGTLKSGQEYIVTRVLSAGMDGYLPWKLEVIKVSDESVHTSATNYAYAAPATPEKINILQINTGYGVGLPLDGVGLPLDSTRPTIANSSINATRNTILDLIGSISSDYNIKIQTCTTNDVNAIGDLDVGGDKISMNNTISENTTHGPYYDVKEFIYSYDMVIIGFDDCYRELDKESSTAIVDYLKDNHPILYTHDTTSMSNVPQVYNSNKSQSNYKSTGAYWGYYFNSILRDPLGLDRYGITNVNFGLTSKSGPVPNTSTSGLVAAGYEGLGTTAVTKEATPITPTVGTTITKDVLLDEGYSIAYLPGSNIFGTGGTPIGTTQGFTNYMFSGNATSYEVTQVNKGMITTYPFNVNTTAFGGPIDRTSTDSISSMEILETHQQYYQANMNPDDVVVWYCLSGPGYDFNDAASAYYIFSNGNATYSGFGHNLNNIRTPEAQLFVNSIIAAYRITNFPPVIKFTDANGNNPLSEFLVPADSGGTLLPATGDASLTDSSRNLYFTVNDTNVAKDKTVKAIVSYINPSSGAESQLKIPIYDSQTGVNVTTEDYSRVKDTLVSGLAYYVKIDDVLKKLAAANVEIPESGLTFNVITTTHVRGTDLPAVSKPITLRKLMLFDLG